MSAPRSAGRRTLVAPLFPHLIAVATAPVFRRVFEADLARFQALVERAG